MAANPFGDVGGFIIEKIFSGVLYFGIFILILGVIGGVFYYVWYYRRKFDIIVKVKSQRAGEQKVYFDKAAILYDRKDKNKFFRLLDGKVDLPVPPFQVIQRTNWGDMIEVWRKGENTYVFLLPPTIDTTSVVRHDGRVYPIGESEQKQIEGDVDYWNTLRKQKNRSLFSSDSWLSKILPFLPMVFAGVITIFVIYILMNTLPTILSEMKSLVTELHTLKGAEVTTYVGQ